MSAVSAAVADLVTVGALAASAAGVRLGRPQITRWWPVGFGAAAVASLIGAVHHLAFPPSATGDRGSAASFAVAGVALAIALAALLSASVMTLAMRRANVYIGLAWAFAAVFTVAAVAGKGTVGPLVVSQLPTMVGIVGVWLVAALRRQRGARAVVGAFVLTGASASAYVAPVHNLGLWLHVDPVTFQHLLQLPGLACIALAVRFTPGNSTSGKSYSRVVIGPRD
ncbi:MAG: hypothetical protein JWN95_182 [Frankiales bacterium]|nr:hypothetical protein [Frankiales bacterium]